MLILRSIIYVKEAKLMLTMIEQTYLYLHILPLRTQKEHKTLPPTSAFLSPGWISVSLEVWDRPKHSTGHSGCPLSWQHPPFPCDH